MHIVEEAQDRKGTGQRLADRIARPLVPGIMVLAGLVAGIGALLGDPVLWIERALVVLVAASPCALAISVPLSVVAAIGAASRNGALVKGGAALEELGRIRVIALDKTGTLTGGRPEVIDVVTSPGTSRDEALALAAALECRSEHPLAKAILQAATEVTPADDVTAIAGHGLRGTLGGAALRLGKPGWLAPGELAVEVDRLQRRGATVVLAERDSSVIAAIAVRDELRPEVAEAIRQLTALGVETAMLTGDNASTAAALAAQAGIAMGAMGTDVAIETADVALMGEDLRHLPQVLAHARHARTVMLQNIGLSLAIIGVLIPLAATGVLGLATVVFVHELAEVLVILNAIRAGRAVPLPGDPAAPAPHTDRPARRSEARA